MSLSNCIETLNLTHWRSCCVQSTDSIYLLWLLLEREEEEEEGGEGERRDTTSEGGRYPSIY